MGRQMILGRFWLKAVQGMMRMHCGCVFQRVKAGWAGPAEAGQSRWGSACGRRFKWIWIQMNAGSNEFSPKWMQIHLGRAGSGLQMQASKRPARP
jgi:hypothetical protein